MRRALTGLAVGLLALGALAGLGLSVAFVALSTGAGRSLLVPPLLSLVNAEIAGRLSLRSFAVGAGGGLELSGLELRDPEDEVVLEVERVRAVLDLSGLGSRRIALRAEVERPRLRLVRDAQGGTNLERAVAPRRPGPGRADGGPSAWTLRVARLALRQGEFSWQGAPGTAPIRADGLTLEARALVGPRGARAEVALSGALHAPEERPFRLEATASADGSRVLLPLLRARLGETALEAVAEGDLTARRGRAALLQFALDADDARALAPEAPLRDLRDLRGQAYGEWDGRAGSAALELRPGSGGRGGSARAAAVLQTSPAPPALGFEVLLDALDPSQVLALLPPGELRLRASGQAAGSDLASLRGRLQVSVEPSRLRGGRFGPAEVRARAQGGAIEVSRLDGSLPGAVLRGSGQWRPRGTVAASLSAELTSLEVFTANLRALLGATLPDLRGSARLEASLGGTAAAPNLRVEAASERLRIAGLELRQLTARALLEGLEAEASLSARMPELGSEPFDLRARGTFQPGRQVLGLAELGLAWPGTRFALAGPARVELDGPRVDRLELRSGPQRLVLEGGLRGQVLAVTAGGEQLDLARVPEQLLPDGLGLGGRLAFQLSAQGRAGAPLATVHLELSRATARGLSGVDLTADLRWDGPARRASGSAAVWGLAGGEASLRADLPVDPTRAGAAEPLSLRIGARGLRLADLWAAAGVEVPLTGTAGLSAELGGTAGAPTLSGSATLDDGRFQDFTPLAARVSAEVGGGRARASGTVDHGGSRALEAELEGPLDLLELWRAPDRTGRGLGSAPLTGRAAVPGLDLKTLAGRGGLPGELAGKLTARAELSGSALAPRGTVQATVEGGALAGWKDLDLDAEAQATGPEVELRARVGAAGQQLVQLTGSLGLAPEALADGPAREKARLRLQAIAQGVDLSRIPGPLALAGALDARLEAQGSLAAPELQVEAHAQGLGVGGHPAGDLEASARAGGRQLRAEALLRPTGGGTVRAELTAEAEIAPRKLWRDGMAAAPARAQVVAEHLDLGFLPAAAPGLVRSASGTLDARLSAAGPLARLRPAGTVQLTDGRIALSGMGDWNALALDLAIGDDVIEVKRLYARRGRGWLEASGQARGLSRAAEKASFEAELRSSALTLTREGQELATLYLRAQAQGSFDAQGLDAEVTVAGDRVVLPRRSPRTLQSLKPRLDVVVGTPRAQEPAAGGPGYRVAVRVRVPGPFRVEGELPRINVGLRGDLLLVSEGGLLRAEGRMESTGGVFEDYGRSFSLRRAVATFGGGALEEGIVDAEALYDNPMAKVKISVSGPLSAPTVKMTSDPPYDEGQIAMLIATGRIEVKAGSGAVGPGGGSEAGNALLGALAMSVLRETLQDKLPLDTVSLDAGQIRMGKYLSDKVYVGYTLRTNASRERGENQSEGRFEYQVSPRWTFELRYGDANAGAASLVWSKDY